MQGAGGIVFVVDDDLAVREALKFVIELDGYSVRACGSGMELLDHGDLPSARCVVLDYKMPAMNGLEVLDRLWERRPSLPIIFVTGQLGGAFRGRAQAAGVHYILEKPLMNDALANCIREILGAGP